jgi:hypothetical protein
MMFDFAPPAWFMADTIENDFGIDTLDVIVNLWPLLHGDSKDEMENGLNAFKRWITSKIDRSITASEESGMLHCLLDYTISEPATDARMDAMNKLFGLKFLTK